MTKPNSIALIIISLVLLAIFELLWLQRVWREQYDRLEQETNYLFQQAISTLQDSLVQQSMRSHNVQTGMPDQAQRTIRFRSKGSLLPSDTIVQRLKMESSAKIMLRMDSTTTTDWRPADSADLSQFQVFVIRTTDHDSASFTGLDRLLTDLPGKFQLPVSGRQVFTFEKNTIPISGLKKAYRANLRAAGIPLEFDLVHQDSLPFAKPARGFFTKPALAGLLVHHFYTAYFQSYHGYLLRQILPSLAFALLLFGVTATAFLLIYRSMRQQQRLTRLKNEFISNITHELKTPITTVGVALEALNSFDVRNNPEKSREYLAHSKRELDRLSLLVEKVLRLSMFEEQEPRLKLETFDLAAVVQQVAAAMSLQAERVGAAIHIQLPENDPVYLHGDRLHLSSVIFNLLDNALKYTSRHPVIHISLEKINERVSLQVRDNGIGIPEALHDKVFDKFFRVQDGDRHDVKGHGLGLSYAAMVVRQHQGRIWVESTPGIGSTFIAEFQAAAPPA